MVLLEFSMSPMNKGESVSPYVARSLDIIDKSAHFADGEHLFRSNVNGCRGGVAR